MKFTQKYHFCHDMFSSKNQAISLHSILQFIVIKSIIKSFYIFHILTNLYLFFNMHIFGSTEERFGKRWIQNDHFQVNCFVKFSFTSASNPELKTLFYPSRVQRQSHFHHVLTREDVTQKCRRPSKSPPREGQTLTNPIAHELPMLWCFKSPHQLSNASY